MLKYFFKKSCLIRQIMCPCVFRLKEATARNQDLGFISRDTDRIRRGGDAVSGAGDVYFSLGC